MKDTILVTGITGFLGSHIGKMLCENDYKVFATRRQKSILKNCCDYEDKISWINVDEDDWKDRAIAVAPATIVHAAWTGVAATERDDWELQTKNLSFLQDLLDIAQRSNSHKIIGLGSQAEYGRADKIISESGPLRPSNAYGALKIVASEMIKGFAHLHQVSWYWCRVFSVFGENEGADWLLPSVIQNMLAKKKGMDFSPGDQEYAYLYVKDFAEAIEKVITSTEAPSGCYNISGIQPLALKDIITLIRNSINQDFQLNFGALPYRDNQSTLVAGDMTLYNKTFGTLPTTPLEQSIQNTIEFYTSNLPNEGI